jgi:hypothetical protein
MDIRMTSAAQTMTQALSPLLGTGAGAAASAAAGAAAAGAAAGAAVSAAGAAAVATAGVGSAAFLRPRRRAEGDGADQREQCEYAFHGLSLQGIGAGFAGPDADDLFEIENEDLAVADLAGTCRLLDGFDDLIDLVALDGGLDLHFRQKVDDILGAPVQLGMPFCRPKPFTSVTVMPCTPMADRASRTSSSLNGLMMAVTNFMSVPQLNSV